MTATEHRIAAGLAEASATLKADRVVVGTFIIELPAPATIRVLALSGFDFVVLDLEHSMLDLAGVEPLLAEARASGIATLVRVPADRLSAISNVLDAGATGVMVPHVDGADRAREVVAHARFAPLGERGYSPLTFLTALTDPQRVANRDQVVVVQIEGVEGIRNAREIGSVPGIDGVFAGPYDLAESLGTPSDISGAAVAEAARRIADALPPPVRLGIYMDDPSHSAEWARRGFTLQCIGYDAQLLRHRASSIIQTVRESAAPTT